MKASTSKLLFAISVALVIVAASGLHMAHRAATPQTADFSLPTPIASRGDLTNLQSNVQSSSPPHFPSNPLATSVGPLIADFSFPAATPRSPATFTAAASGGLSPYNFTWNFGDNYYCNAPCGTATGNPATYSYYDNSGGTYIVVLTVKDNSGTVITVSHVITVRPSPILYLGLSSGYSAPVANAGSPVTFTTSPQGGTPPYTFSWDFNDTHTGVGSPVTHTYSTAGSYVIAWTARDTAGNTAAASLTFIVKPASVLADFSSPPANSNRNWITFTAVASGGTGSYTYSWNFGDDYYCNAPCGTATANPAIYRYTSAETYVVRLVVVDSAGHNATVSHYLVARPTNLAYLTFTSGYLSPVATLGSPVTLTGSAQGTSPYTFSWDFNDTFAGTGAAVTHRYAKAGIYTVVMFVRDAAGNNATASLPLTVQASLIRADFSFPAANAGRNWITFSGLASGGTGSYNFTWNFGDDYYCNTPCGTATGSPAVYRYTLSEMYVVTMTVKDTAGHNATVSHYLVTRSTALSYLSFSSGYLSPTASAGSPVTLTGSAQGGTLPYSISWDFNDTATGIGTSVTHVYAKPGVYVIVFVVKDGAGNNATASLPLIVQSSPVVADFSFPAANSNRNWITFTAIASGGTGPYNFVWNFGDDYYCNVPCGTAIGNPVTYRYTTAETYIVTLTVKDGSGHNATVSHYLVARPTNLAYLTFSSGYLSPDATVGSPVSLTASAQGGTLPYRFSWDLNDSSTGIGPAVTHTYTIAGTYVVIVNVKDSAGNNATVSLPLLVRPTPFHADFSSPPVTARNTVTFLATASGATGPYTYSWNFGSDYYCNAPCGTATGNPASYWYGNGGGGTYVVTLLVKDSKGNNATVSHVTVAAPATIQGGFGYTPGSIGNPMVFTASASGGTGSYTFTWDFNDSSSGTSNPTTHTYSIGGLYIVLLIIRDGGGHNATVSSPVILPDFSISTNPPSTSIAVGSSGSSTINLTSLGNFTGTVSLSISTSPNTGLSASMTTDRVFLASAGQNSTILRFNSSTPGTYSITVVGNGGPVPRSATVRVTVGSPAADFTLTPTSTTITVAANSLGTDKLRVDAIHGFTGTVSFQRVGSPFGGVSYDCSSVTLSATTISADSTCTFSSNTPGTYTAVVNGTGGTPSVSHQVTYTVIVVENTPSIHTTLSATTITVGGSVTDSATLTGTDTLTAGGAVTYQFFSGSSCAGTATVVGTPVVVNSGVIPNSDSQKFSSAGLFSWNAVYSGDANNNGATSLCEPLSVNPLTGVAVTTELSATTITVGGSVSDSATLSGVTPAAGGTVIYHMFNTGDCSSPVIVVATVNVANGVVPNSPSKIFSSPGFFGWNAAYSGDANNSGANSICEPLTVNKASPTLSTTLSASTITVGGSVSDTATLAGGFTPTGSVRFSFYSGDCSSLMVTIILPPVGLTGSSATSIPEAFNTVGSFSWSALYLGDSNNNGATSSCESLSVVEAVGFTISASPTSLTVAPEDSSSCEGQGSAQRCDDEASSTITVTGLNGFAGTVALTVSTPPGLTVSLSTLRITGSGSSTLTVSDGRPGNYTVTVTGTSGSITQSVTVNVMVRPPVPLKCGGDSDCNIESDAPLSDVRFGDKKIHFTVDGTAGARGAVNVTIPRSAVPDIDRIEVSVDGAKQPRSSLMIAADGSNYHVYFSFTFHSPVVIDIDLAPAVTILGLAPLTFYGIVGGGIAAVVIGGIFAVFRRRRTLVQK